MQDLVTWFDPPPTPDERPARLADPFVAAPPHPLAARAAATLLDELARGLPGIDLAPHDRPGRGKMFGVLVVGDAAGRTGWLRGFSGMLDGRWRVDGFAPPLFDVAAHAAIWSAGQDELDAFATRLATLAGDARRALADERTRRSHDLYAALCKTYAVPNARGEQRSLPSLYGGAPPPGGAGDCAAPRLLAAAYRAGLAPLALAEVWWGAPPLEGGREAGAFYPACTRKCGGVLPFMLEGVAVDWQPRPAPARPRVVHEDAALVVAWKPPGLVCAPDRHDRGHDSLVGRLGLAGAHVVHPLDPEASGLQLIARDRDTFAELARRWALGHIEARSTAWLDGSVSGEAGVIELPLRLDRERRPRRVVDEVGGKHAVTAWRVLDRRAGLTRVALWPRTGRTHQLRVHAADPRGLGAAIVGDGIYGSPGARLELHADALAFAHPRSDERLTFADPAPF